jgi:hypothetical protein
MIFKPTETEKPYLDILENSTHGEFVLIRMTPTMLKKSIIDASLPFRLLLKENMKIDYNSIQKGVKNGFKSEIQLLIGKEIQTRTISYYRPETKKGDPRFWISKLHHNISAFDMLLLTVWENKLYAIPLIGDIEIFTKSIKDIFQADKNSLPLAVQELQSHLQEIYQKNWIKTHRAGDTGVGKTFEDLLEIDENSSKNPDYKGVEIKCSRENSSTLQTLFSKTPNYANLENKRKDLVVKHGYWDDKQKRHALYVTIKVSEENSKGWKLELDDNEEKIYATKNGKKIVYYEYKTLQNSLAQKHKQTLFVKALSKDRKTQNDKNEMFLYKSAFYCEESSFINFLSLLTEGKISVDFLIHHNPNTNKTRDHGFLWRIKKEYIPLLFKKQIKLTIF